MLRTYYDVHALLLEMQNINERSWNVCLSGTFLKTHKTAIKHIFLKDDWHPNQGHEM